MTARKDFLQSLTLGKKSEPTAEYAPSLRSPWRASIVHMVRNSLRYVGWKKKKEVAADLKAIYSASTVEEAELALTSFSEKWDAEFPSIAKSWLTHWERIVPFFAYPAEIRRVIYTLDFG
ncbi:transposase [Candidiatus Paracoxiella cheracis]|uniref:transposase n=1 Tax=Candidiatus Paracoxiella cheracis TaxID=3405120 RepID=UPI003BF55B9E